jgi:hypothetical protein
VFDDAGDWITARQLRERCTDPWAPPLTEDWLADAFERGLVKTRRRADFPAEWRLSRRGKRALG